MRPHRSWPRDGVVARPSGDARSRNGTLEFNPVVRPIIFEFRWLIDEQVLVPLFCLHQLEISPNICRARMDEGAATGLASQIVQGLVPVRTMRAAAAIENVNSNTFALAHVDGFAQVCVTGIVFAVREEQDEVAGRFRLLCPLVPAGNVERVKDGRIRSVAIGPWSYSVRPRGDVGVHVGPALREERTGVKLHDEGQIVASAKEAGSIGLNDRPVKVNILEDRGTDVE